MIKKQSKQANKKTKKQSGDDVRNFEPRTRLSFEIIDKSIRELRAMYKVRPEWFETPKPKSNKGQNVVEYTISIRG